MLLRCVLLQGKLNFFYNDKYIKEAQVGVWVSGWVGKDTHVSSCMHAGPDVYHQVMKGVHHLRPASVPCPHLSRTTHPSCFDAKPPSFVLPAVPHLRLCLRLRLRLRLDACCAALSGGAPPDGEAAGGAEGKGMPYGAVGAGSLTPEGRMGPAGRVDAVHVRAGRPGCYLGTPE